MLVKRVEMVQRSYTETASSSVREYQQLGFVTLDGNLAVRRWVMTVNSVTKSHVKISSQNSRETKRYDFKGPLNVQLHKRFFKKCDDQYSEYQLNSDQ